MAVAVFAKAIVKLFTKLSDATPFATLRVIKSENSKKHYF